MKIVYSLMIIGSLFLSACASTQMEQELKYGKIQFEDGNFKGAFHRLLPLAYAGNNEAQYAVGYMYYYGYGVARDEESALFWLKRAKSQYNKAAIQALKLIEKTRAPEPLPILDQKPETTNVQDSMLRTDALTQTKSGGDPKPESEPGRYTVQLFGSNQVSDLQFLKKQLQLDERMCRMASSEKRGKNWYVLTYGRYSLAEEAREAKSALPEQVLALEPWVRNTDNLHFMS